MNDSKDPDDSPVEMDTNRRELPQGCSAQHQSTIINKGITYLVVIFLLISLCVQAAVRTDQEGRVHFDISTREVPPTTSLIYLGLIGSALAIPMDKIALLLGRFLTGGGK